jgi:hypothetical protein
MAGLLDLAIQDILVDQIGNLILKASKMTQTPHSAPRRDPFEQDFAGASFVAD